MAKQKLNLKNKLILCTDTGLPDNVVGAAVLRTPEGVLQHAGIFVRYKGISKLFHYPGHDNKIYLNNFDPAEYYFFRELDFIDRTELKAFMMHCELVETEAKPRYGYHYMGSFYDDNGQLIGVGDQPHYMTCVGFCLNFLKHYNEGKDFMHYEDWDIGSVDDEEIQKLVERVTKAVPGIDIENFSKGMRRIRPKEYVAAAFGTPSVRKTFTDEVAPKIEQHLEKRFAATKGTKTKPKPRKKRA